MAETSMLPAALDAEIDDVLSMLPLIAAGMGVADKVFAQLVDHLAQAVIHDVRVRHERGDLSRADHLTELCQVVLALQERDLLGRGLPPSR